MPSKQSQEVEAIQYLRGVAALMVVVHHALDQFSGFKQLVPTDAGAAGVDVFFIISGFVMMYTTAIHKYRPREFLLRRVIRIVPIYWIMTLFTAVLLLFGSRMVRHSTFGALHLIASLLFLPMQNPGDGGSISPILKLGWTLNYEMFFYLVFAAVIQMRSSLRAAIMGGFFALLCILRVLVRGLPVPLEFWGNPIVFEFVAGCLLADLYLSGVLTRIPTALAVFSGAAGAVGLVTTGFGGRFGVVPYGEYRVLLFGLPALLLVTAFVAFRRGEGFTKQHPILHLIGDASYSIYLTHLFVVIFMRIVWSRLGLPTDTLAMALIFVTACFAGGAGAGCLVYRYVERPATAWARTVLVGERRLQAASAPRCG